MVLKKRVDYGFNGFRLPVVPRAPRSKRGSRKKSVEGSQICAFDLLAAVAGKLLQESESSASSNAAEAKYQLGIHNDGLKQEKLEEYKSQCLDQGSCVESVFVPELAVKKRILNSALREFPHTDGDSVLRHTSIVTTDFSKKVGSNVKLEICESKNAIEKSPTKAEGGSSDHGESCDHNIDNRTERQPEPVGKHYGDLTVANTCSSKDPIGISVNTHVLINSESSVQMPLYGEPVPKNSLPIHRNDVKVGSRDDDENSFRCNQISTKMRAFRPQSLVGYRRIRKMLTSKYWKVAPKLKDCELSNTDGGMKPFYRNKKAFCKREMYQHETPSKRRKLCDHSSKVAYDHETSSESISNSPEKQHIKGDKSGSVANLCRASRVSSSIEDHHASFQSNDSHVKFSIKSFKVPELYIEVPETSTVGSLERTVMEAVTSVLGGGLRVGVLFQGKKLRNDNRTLLQTGISRNVDLDTLGFMLEPSYIQASPPPKDPPLLLLCDAPRQLSRFPTSPILESGFSNASFDPPPVTNMGKHVENNHELIPSATNLLTDGTVPDANSLVPISAMSAEALAVVRMSQKTKRTEYSHRRIRRPFSVSEVEALVAAVEKLGSGRWRDVKMRAFDDANHRTYVDLKDKWKTLVHTASISPQQRRGEPVPQELLDRVLAAHAYWSQHQSKLHSKHQAESLQISEARMEAIEA